MQDTLQFYPLTAERWPAFEELFGPRGACGGCWCMWWRLSRKEYERNKGDGNRAAMRNLVKSGSVPGMLAFDGDKVVGWCAFAPRESLDTLQRSRILKAVDDEPVWSIVCFFIAKEYRQKGLTVELINAACGYIALQGGRICESYPVEPRKKQIPSVFAYTGLAAAFRKAGFREVARRSETRPIMRRILADAGN
ncbi:MAG: GNAT family N-acetyltransferase [Calditrichia bacterium]